MAFIKVTFTEVIDSAFPMFGAFEFTDIFGEVIVIREKLPVIGEIAEQVEVGIPQRVDLECSVISEVGGVLHIDTGTPHGIADIHGRTRFQVSADLLVT